LPERQRRAPTKASERLRRLLVVVPYIVRHPGSRIADLTTAFDVDERELLEDLERLFLSGLPPYGPGDLIGVDIQDGRVWIDMADYFARPLRMTKPEARALFLQGTQVAAMPGPQEPGALSSALAKLASALGEDLERLAEHVEVAEDGRPLETLDGLREAVRAHERVVIGYFAASTGETTTRAIDPEEVFFAMGNWYVAAWDHRSDQERLFRVDRIRSVEPSGERFEPRGLRGAGRPLYTPTEADVPIRLRVGPDGRWIAEYYAVDQVEELPDGGLEAVFPASRLEWVARLVLRLGPEVEILDPPVLKDRVREVASLTRKRYVPSSPDGGPEA
jgi:proteasome accessory factor C